MKRSLTLRRTELEAYLKRRFKPSAQLLTFGEIGEESSGPALKRYGYGCPIRVTFRMNGRRYQAVLETMKPGPFGHEHMADRAQAILWDYDSYNRLPRHARALDVGAFAKDGTLLSVARAKEFFLLTGWVDGKGYNLDLERLARTGRLGSGDKARACALARYLAKIHRVKRRDPSLYWRRLRELIGHGECIMGLTDSYPDDHAFITKPMLRRIEEDCNRWRWKLRSQAKRLCQVHGDFHPWNILFRRGVDFSVLDRSRGEWGEAADDVTALTINYLFASLRRWGTCRGPFEILFREFWDAYLEASHDPELAAVTAPFFTFRGLVIAHPLWYPDLSISVRKTIFRFIHNVLNDERFDPAAINKYCTD
jgi:hypothetical protein